MPSMSDRTRLLSSCRRTKNQFLGYAFPRFFPAPVARTSTSCSRFIQPLAPVNTKKIRVTMGTPPNGYTTTTTSEYKERLRKQGVCGRSGAFLQRDIEHAVQLPVQGPSEFQAASPSRQRSSGGSPSPACDVGEGVGVVEGLACCEYNLISS